MTDIKTPQSLQRDLSFSIGLHPRLKPMLEAFSQACIRLLGLNAVHFYIYPHSLPQTLHAELTTFDSPLAHFLTISNNPELAHPHNDPLISEKLSQPERLPSISSGTTESNHQHPFTLPDIGVLILTGDKLTISADMLSPVIEHLSKVCANTLKYEFLLDTDSENQTSKQTLKNSQSQLAALFKGLKDGIVIINEQGTIKSINPILLNMFGYSRDELTGRHMDIFMPPHIKKMHSRGIQHYIDTQDDARIIGKGVVEISAQRKNKEVFPVEISISKVSIDDSTHFLGIIRDISTRHYNEEKLQRSHQHISNLLENSSDVFLLINSDGQVLYLNSRAEELFGRRREELLHRKISDVLPGLAHHFHDILHSVSHDVAPQTHESTYPMLGRWFESRAFVTQEGLGIYLHDITSQKRTEEAMQKARDAALASAKAKSQFLANMSHEIRTPMNGVLGMLDLLRESELDQDQKTFAETAHRSAESLLTLLNDVLDISKVEAGKLSLESMSVDISILIRDCLMLPSRQAKKKHLSLNQTIDDDVPQILQADPTRLRQILNNLLNNAIKFTHEGSVSVHVSKINAVTELEISHIKFKIIDTGVGIPEEHQQNIFQLFTQADGSTTRKYGGTGLGLAICQRLIEAMGGTIGVESIPDHGSCFYFTLPEIPVDN